MDLPDLDSLRCLVAAASHPSFRRAAKEVALSPAAFGERIKRLEEQLGERLFDRSTRSCRLTKAGERAVPHARAALDAARRCGASGREAEAPFDLVIGTRFELGLSWLVPALPKLAENAPPRRLHLFFGDSDALLAALTERRADAAVTSARLVQAHLETITLHEERYALVLAPSLARTKPLRTHRDAAAHTLLDVHPDLPLFRYFLDGRPPRELWRFAAVQRLGAIAAIRAQAIAGAGVAVLPRYFVTPDLEKSRLVEPLPRARLSVDYFRLVFRRDHPRADDLAALASELRVLPLR